MATSSVMRDYTQLNTVPALVGILFAVAAGVQFLDVQLTVGLLSWSFTPSWAVWVGAGSLIVAFASSDTKDWRHYDTWEQLVVAVAAVTMFGVEYIAEISSLMATYQPTAGIVAFMVSMAAWGVLAR